MSMLFMTGNQKGDGQVAIERGRCLARRWEAYARMERIGGRQNGQARAETRHEEDQGS